MPERFTRTARAPSAAVLALVAAIGLGVAGRIAVHAGARVPGRELVAAALGQAMVSLGAPWLAVAWAVGTLAGSPARAALTGGCGLALGTFAWYALSTVAGGPAEDYARLAVVWAVVALVAGAVFGLGGAAYARGGRLARTAALAAELFAAGAVLALGFRRTAPLLALLLAAIVAVGVAGLEDAVRDTLRMAGWRGL